MWRAKLDRAAVFGALRVQLLGCLHLVAVMLLALLLLLGCLDVGGRVLLPARGGRLRWRTTACVRREGALLEALSHGRVLAVLRLGVVLALRGTSCRLLLCLLQDLLQRADVALVLLRLALRRSSALRVFPRR